MAFLKIKTAMKVKGIARSSQVTNVEAKELIDSLETEALVTFNLDQERVLPRIDFFRSPHIYRVYQEPPTLQFRRSIFNYGAQVGFVVDINAVEAFAKQMLPLCREINNNSVFTYDHSNNVFVRIMNGAAEEAAEELEMEFGNFVAEDSWSDQDVDIVDCEDHWALEEMTKLYSSGMSYNDFERAVAAAQETEETDNFKILGVPYGMIQEAFDAAEN
ncbi:hypothetical protein [Phaeobacter italicus]|uniref:hypothetical protein n=1 Tax=Phaeobacter italicus TaxID=481446 RepID=UPI001CD5B86D|nr:hypothetical protein [Phaeobacter italicus]MCA0858788.1 hypothetical protein [Phaeobacter italicus]